MSARQFSLTPQPASAWSEGAEGLFLLDEPTYRAAKGFNQSAAQDIARSLRHWKQRKDKPKEPTTAMEIGTLVHLIVLEPEKFGKDVSHYIKPETYPDSETSKPKKWTGNANFCKTWLAEHSDKPVITQEEHDQVLGMRDELVKDPMVTGFRDKEIAAFCVDPLTGLLRKARIDLFSFESLGEGQRGIVCADIKKMLDAREGAFRREIAKRGMHIQAAFTIDLLEDLFGKKYPVRFLNRAIESDPPHEGNWFCIKDASLQKGRDIYRKAMLAYKNYEHTGILPGYDKTTVIKTVELPAWEMREESEEES